MKMEPSARRHLCLWLPESLPPPTTAGQYPQRREADKKERDKRRLHAFALWCQQFSPRISIEREPGTRCLPGSTLVMEITGLAPHFGGERGLAKNLSEQLRHRKVTAHLGVADSIGAAWALAHFGHTSSLPREVWLDTPAITLHMISQHCPTLDALHVLPVDALRLEVQTIAQLNSLGIYSIGQLMALPRNQLSSRFGEKMLQRMDQASGTIEEILPVISPPESITTEWFFEFPTANRPILKHILNKLMGRLQKLLHSRIQIPLGIACRLKLQNKQEETFAVSLYHACGDVPHLVELLELRLERTTLSAPVSEVSLTVTDFFQPEHHQPIWFHTEHEINRENKTHIVSLPENPFVSSLHRCLERITSRLGTGGVVQPRWTQDAIPERAIRFRHRIRSSGRSAEKPSLEGMRLRPLWLFRRPKPMHILTCDPHNLPCTFAGLGTHHTIAVLEGPERIESTWHGRDHPQHILRDYYRAETSDLRRFWIFQRYQDRLWFLHGEFD